MLLNNHTSKYNSFILVLYRRYKNHVSVCPPPPHTHFLAHCYATANVRELYFNSPICMLRKWAPYYFYHLWTRVRCCIVVCGKRFSHTHSPWLGWHMNIIILIKITDVCSTFLPLLHIIIIFSSYFL